MHTHRSVSSSRGVGESGDGTSPTAVGQRSGSLPPLQVSPMGDAITYEPFGSTSTLAEGRLCAPAGGVPSASAATQLILSTHQALMSFTPADGCFNVLSRGRGHYYSVLPAHLVLSGRVRAEDEEEEEELLLVGSQRIDAAPARTQPLPDADLLLLVNGRTRRTLGSYRLPTEYLHDSILDGETGDVLAVDASRGEVLLLSMLPLPPRATAGAAAGAANHTGRWRLEVAGGVPGLSVRRRYPVAGAAAHINSVALGRGCVSTVAVLVAPQLTAPASWVDSPRLLPVPCAWGELLNHSGPSRRVWSRRAARPKSPMLGHPQVRAACGYWKTSCGRRAWCAHSARIRGARWQRGRSPAPTATTCIGTRVACST